MLKAENISVVDDYIITELMISDLFFPLNQMLFCYLTEEWLLIEL